MHQYLILRGSSRQVHTVPHGPPKSLQVDLSVKTDCSKTWFPDRSSSFAELSLKTRHKAKKAPGIIALHQKETKPKKMIRSWGGQLDMSGTIAFKRWHHLTSGAGSVGATPLNLTQCSASKRLSHRKLAIVSHGLSEQSRHWGLCQSSWHGTKP